jgi:Tol biopolymer transport system component
VLNRTLRAIAGGSLAVSLLVSGIVGQANTNGVTPALLPTGGFCSTNTQLTVTDSNYNTNEWPVASPDGDWIYFETIYQSHFEVYRMWPDGTHRQDLTSAMSIVDGRDNYGPTLSGDGTKLAFASLGGDGARVILADADGSNPVQISPSNQYAYMIDLNEDGTKAVFANNSLGYEIQLWDGGTSTVTTLTPSLTNSVVPQFTADETGVIFSHKAGSEFYGDIYRVDIDGTDLTNLTDSGFAPHSWQRSYYDEHGSSRQPSIAPDGMILYRQYLNGNLPELFTMNDDGTNVAQLTGGSAPIGDAKWSPDGTMIAFVRASGPAHWQLEVMTAAGGSSTPITEVDGAVLYFNWVGNDAVAYTAEEWGSGVYIPGTPETRDVWIAELEDCP